MVMRIVLEDLLHVIPAAGSEFDVADDRRPVAGPEGKRERRDGVESLKNVALAVYDGAAKGRIEIVFLKDAPGQEFLGLVVAFLQEQPLRETILDFIGVGDRGVGIETDEIGKIVYAGDVTVGKSGLNGVLVSPARFVLLQRSAVEEAFEGRRTEVYGEFAGVAGNRCATHQTGGIERIAVARGAKRSGSGHAEPGAEVYRNRNARREFVAFDEVRSFDSFIAAVHRACKGIEAKIDGNSAPGSLLDGPETRFRRIAKGDAGGWNRGSDRGRSDGKREKALVIERREIETEAAKIIGDKNGAANFRVDGLSDAVSKSQAESKRGELIVISDEPPASAKQRLNFHALLFAALWAAGAIGIEQAAVVDTKIGIEDRGVLKRLGTKFAALEDAAAAHELRANGGVHPGRGSQIKSFAQDEALARALANIWDEESGLADSAAGGSGGVGQPNQRDAEKPKVGVDERDSLAEVNARVGRVELPFGMQGIANGDPGAMDEIHIAGEALDVARFEIKRIVGNQDGGIGPALDLGAAANIVEKAVAGADVVMRFVSLEVLVVIVEQNVAGGDGFEGLAVIFDMVGAKARVSIADVDITIGGGDVTAAALCFCFQLGDAGLRSRQMNLLSAGERCGRAGEGGKKHNQENQGAQREGNLRTGMKIHPEHAINESSWIA